MSISSVSMATTTRADRAIKTLPGRSFSARKGVSSIFAIQLADSCLYLGLFGHVKLEVRKDRAEIKAIEAKVETKKAA